MPIEKNKNSVLSVKFNDRIKKTMLENRLRDCFNKTVLESVKVTSLTAKHESKG